MEHYLVCHVAHFGDALWFATPRTPPLWQRGFFLVNCLVLRRLLASVRSGVVKTFRWACRGNCDAIQSTLRLAQTARVPGGIAI